MFKVMKNYLYFCPRIHKFILTFQFYYEGGSESSVIGVITLLIDMIG